MTHGSEDIPIACQLTTEELHAREATLLAQFRSAVVATEELADGYAFRIADDSKSIGVIAELIAAERKCCPFLTFELAAHANMGPVIVSVTGPGTTKEFVRMMLSKSDESI